METMIFKSYGTTVFEREKNQIALRTLFGIPMQIAGFEAPDRIKGIFNCYTEQGVGGEKDLELLFCAKEGNVLRTRHGLLGQRLIWESLWTFDMKNGIVSREDWIENQGETSLSINKCQPRFLFATGEYDCYAQNSTWCYENNGGWEPLGRNGVYLKNENGRTTQGSTPMLGIRNRQSQRGLIFHILPKGNWEMHLKKESTGVGMQGHAIISMELGQCSDHFAYTLKSKEKMALPQILIQAMPTGSIHSVSENLHRWIKNADTNYNRIPQKIAYNPWFDSYDHIDVERFKERARIAKSLGCELFEVDAGWYGIGKDWGECVGDWREKQDGAFYGNLKEFSDYIRELGMDFGLWMEPERVAANAPARMVHPEWFAYGSGEFYYPKLWEVEAYDYIKGEILRLIDTYKLKWMKMDFNFELGQDPTHSEFLCYYEAWYRMLEEIKKLRPDVFLEGCASGGLRTDINTMIHFDGHFLCDNVNPWDNQSMYEQLLVRGLPSKVYRWVVLQKGANIPAYFREISDVEKTIIVPAAPGAGFAEHEKIDMDFLCKLMFNGMVGLSGDIATLDQEDLDYLKAYIAFYKEYRDFFREAVVSIDGEPSCIGERSHIRVVEYFQEEKFTSLFYVYRFEDLRSEQIIYPKNISSIQAYWIKGKNGQERKNGHEILEDGIKVVLPKRNSGEILLVEPCMDTDNLERCYAE